MTMEQQAYKSYLLRLWRVEQNGRYLWRASLESAQTGQKEVFADQESLIAYLRRETGEEHTQLRNHEQNEQNGQ